MAETDDGVGGDEAAQPEEGLSPESVEDVRIVAKGGAVQITGQASQRGLATLFTALATRVLGPAGYGVYRQVAQVLTIAGQLGLAGFNYASMRFIARARAEGNAGGVRGAARVGLAGAAVASAVVVVVLIAGARPLADAFTEGQAGESDFAAFFRLGAAYVPFFALMQVLRYCTQAYKTMVPSVMAGNVVQPAARFLLGAGALAAGMAVTGAVVSLVVSEVVGALAAAFYYRRILTEEERRARPSARPGPMMRFAFPQAGASLLGVQTLGLGIIVLGLYSSDFQVGLFAIALSLQGPGTMFLSGIVNIWAPVVSDLYDRQEIERLGALYKTISRWVATFSFPVFAVLILEPDLFTAVLAGSEGLPAAPVVAVLALGNIFYTGTGPTGYVISMSGHPGLNFANSIVAVAVYILAGIAVVPDHGALGMAVVDAGVTMLINSIRVLEAWMLIGIHPFGRSFLKPVVSTLAGAAVLLLWKLIPGDAALVELAGIAVAACTYVGLLRAFGLDAEERLVWNRIAGRLFRRRAKKQS